eukprot:242381-Chlamydomonas_euryale.AAC.2
MAGPHAWPAQAAALNTKETKEGGLATNPLQPWTRCKLICVVENIEKGAELQGGGKKPREQVRAADQG